MSNHYRSPQSYRKYQATRRETRRHEFAQGQIALGAGIEVDGCQLLIDSALRDGYRLSHSLVEKLIARGYEVPEQARPVSVNLEVERELPESLESPFWSQAEGEEQDDRENDALYHSRSEMPAYQSNDLDWELARSEWGWKHGDRDGEPEDYGLSEDDLDYDWDRFVGGDEPNPEWYQLEENERRQRRDDEDTIPMEEIDPDDYADPDEFAAMVAEDDEAMPDHHSERQAARTLHRA